MNSNEINQIMQKIEVNKGQLLTLTESEKEILNYLVLRKYIDFRQSIDSDSTSVLKLREYYESIKKDIIKIRMNPDFQKKNLELKQNYERLLQQEQNMKSEIISKTELNSLFQGSVNINGTYYFLTYSGRELLNNLTLRKNYLTELSLDDFIDQLNQISTYFIRKTMLANDFTGIFKQKLPYFDESYLNSLAFSVAIIDLNAFGFMDTFMTLIESIDYSAINPEFTPYIAEIVILNSKGLDIQNLNATLNKFNIIFRTIQNMTIQFEDQVAISSLFLPLANVSTEEINHIFREANYGASLYSQKNNTFKSTVVLPFVILAIFQGDMNETAIDYYHKLYFKLNGSYDYNYSSAIATALYLISEKGSENLFERFNDIKNYLTRFGEDGHMLSALMLAQLPLSVEEILDIIRTACNQILVYFKGISGLENLNLAIKMILQSSYNPEFINKTINMLDNIPLTDSSPIGRTMMPFMTSPTMVNVSAIRFSSTIYAGTVLRSTRWYYSRYHFHPIHRHYMHG